MRLLLVDDDSGFRASCGRPSRTSTSTSTRPPVRPRPKRIARREPDVIVLDVGLPGMDGLAFCRELKGSPDTSSIRVVLLTGMEDVEEVAGAAGADALLLKPFRPLELLGVVERLAGAGVARRCAARRPLRRGAARSLRARPASSGRDRARPAWPARERLPRDGLRARDGARHQGHGHAPALPARAALRTRARGRDRPGARGRSRARVRLPASRHRQDRRAGPDPAQAGHAERRRVAPDEGAHRARRADDRRRQLPPRCGLQVVRSHHERWDGTRLSGQSPGDEIPIGARIFAVADAVDAITDHRPYRQARSWRACRQEIVAEQGKQFDPDVVDAFRDREHTLHEIRREFLAAA